MGKKNRMQTAGSEGQHRSTKRVLSILDALAKSGTGMTMAEICRELKAPKSSLFPILHTMAEEGYLSCSDETGRYSIGYKTYLAGKAYDRNGNELGVLRNQLQQIVDACGETSQVGILNQSSVLYIAKVDSPQPIRLVSDIGRALPIHCTAIGKALVSDMKRDELEQLIGSTFDAHTPRTITDIDTLYRQIEKIRAEGVAHDYGEITDAVECIAAPVRVGGRIKYGIGISVPSYRLNDAKRSELASLLKTSSSHLEVLLSQ